MGTTSIRLATAADAEQIRAIYNYEVMHTTATFDLVPRSLADQQEWLAARSGAFAAIVAVDTDTDVDTDVDVGAKTAVDVEGGAGQVVGFGALSPYKERAAYRTSVENSVYVRSDCQGRGIGRLLLQELLNTAELSGFHAVFARINATGDASIALHTRCGFQLVGIEREVGRKFSRWHDVALMQRLL